MKKICFYHPDFPGGGAERITFDIVKYLRKMPDEYQVHVVTQHLKPQFMSTEESGILDVVQLPEDLVSLEMSLERLFNEHRFDVFVQVGGGCLPFLRRIADINGTKVVFAHHNETLWEKKMIVNVKEELSRTSAMKWLGWILFRKFAYVVLGKAERKAYRICRAQYDYSDCYTVLCEGYRRGFVKWFRLNPDRNKIVVMHNPEYDVEDVNYDKKNTIIYVGRLSYPDKRVDRLLKIWKMVQDKLPEYDLKIIGDGRERDRLHALARKLHLERLSFEGFRTDVSEYYREASISCLVSSVEGWGLCLTESQANGVIPVSFETSAGVSEVLSPDGENGFLVKPFSLRLFARTLVSVARLPEEEKLRLRHNVVRKSRQYPVEDICEKWRLLFDSLVSNG